METPGLSHKFAMKNYLSLLCSTSLFNGLTAEELQTLLSQLGAVVRSYGKGEALVLAGEPSRRVGIVLNGELEAYRPGPQGTRIPITHMEPGGVFGDVLGGSSRTSPVTVVASAPCEVCSSPTSSFCCRTAARRISWRCAIWCAPSAINIFPSPAG